MSQAGIICDPAGRKCSPFAALGHRNALRGYWSYLRMDERDEGLEDSRVGDKPGSRRDENMREERTKK